MKFFDYKFILLVSLTMIVYFMYREIEHLNKRVLNLENNSNKVSVPLVNSLPLPLPPVKQNTVSIDTNNLNIKTGTVEEYSNEIYSNDMGNSNQPTSVESIIDMTKPVDAIGKKSTDFLSSDCSTSTSDSVDHDINLDNTESESIILDNNNSSSDSNQPEQTQPEQTQSEQTQSEQTQPKQTQPHDQLEQTKSEHQSENKTSKEDLLKKKLTELQELATKNNISLTLDGSTKKKTKMQLINEMI